MIYDRVLEVFKLDTKSRSPLERRLFLHSAHYYAPMTVYHRTYFQAVQAGESIDRMVQIPAPAKPLDATMYAVPDDGHVYKITEAQPTEDADGLPVVNLSLHREEVRYDLFRPGDVAENGDG